MNSAYLRDIFQQKTLQIIRFKKGPILRHRIFACFLPGGRGGGVPGSVTVVTVCWLCYVCYAGDTNTKYRNVTPTT